MVIKIMQDTADTVPTSPPLHSQLTLFSKTTRLARTYVTSFPGGMRNAKRIASFSRQQALYIGAHGFINQNYVRKWFVSQTAYGNTTTYREYVMRCSLSSIRWSNRNTFNHGCNWQQPQVREVVSSAGTIFDNNSYDRWICHTRVPRQRTFGNGILRNTYKLLEF